MGTAGVSATGFTLSVSSLTPGDGYVVVSEQWSVVSGNWLARDQRLYL